MQYIPKGSMCAACERKNMNCKDLNFSAMEVIPKYSSEDLRIVLCKQFKNIKPKPRKDED